MAGLAVVLLGLLGSPAQAGIRPLQIGFNDSLFAAPDPSLRDYWLERAVETGATVARIDVHWSQIAPATPPIGFDASDPRSPGYEWSRLDAAVRAASASGLRVLLTVYSAPAWAEGAGRPTDAYPGAWEPAPGPYGAFATALAKRYSGSFPDPLLAGASLPKVSLFEAWNEPNLDNYLSPQWRGNRLTGPGLYRMLLNRFYASVKSVQPSATIVGGSLAPFGDAPGGARTPPVQFLRDLLCLRGDRLRPIACRRPAHLDVLSHHPIGVGAPSASAASPLDATAPDLGRLTRVLRRAEQTKRVLPRGTRPLWITEFWYDSNPPDPDGVPIATQARWYEQDLFLFWRQGATLAVALQIRDAARGAGYGATYQSGVYFLDGRPKPSQTALRFPFVADRLSPFLALIWGIAPRRGTVQIQALRHGRWRTLTSLHAAGPGHPFTAKLRLFRPAKLRARIGQASSLTWMQR